MKKVISSILCVCLAFLCFAGTKTEVSAAPAESLGASEACAGHTLGTFSGVPACVNENGDLHVCENNFPDEGFRPVLTAQEIFMFVKTIFLIKTLEIILTSKAVGTGILHCKK